MKNKPTRHKESNTFKFQPFSERIANIDVDVFHRVQPKNEDDPEGFETYFHAALEKWGDLNLTESFEAFRKEIPATHTLPQVLQQKDDIVAILIKYIKLKNPLCLQPILELVVALARDLQQEFYPHYSEFVHNLIDLLNTKDTEVLEWTFTCLAFLSKFLWRHLVKDVGIVFNELLPLLEDSKPDYINNFAAESFAFVARKVKDKRSFLLLVLKTLKKHPEGVAGCGRLLFEVMHGVSGQFHSCADIMLPAVFEMLADKSVSQSLLFEVLTCMVEAMLKFIQPKKAGLFWTSAFKTVGSFVSLPEDDALDRHIPACLVLKLVLQAVRYRNAVFVSDPVVVSQQIIELLKLEVLSEDIHLVSSEIGATLLMSPLVSLPQEYVSSIIFKVLAVPYTSVFLMFVQRVLTYPAFELLVLPQLIQHCQNISFYGAAVGVAGIGQNFLNLLARMILHKAPLCETGMDLKRWHQYPLNFTNSTCREELNKKNVTVPSLLLDVLCVKDVYELLKKVEGFLYVTICLPHIKHLDQELALKHLKHVLLLLCSALEQTSDVETKQESGLSENTQLKRECKQGEDILSEEQIRVVLLVLSTVVETLIHLSDSKTLKDTCDVDTLVNSVLSYTCDHTNLSALRALDLYLTACKLEEEEAYCLKLFGRLYSKLLQNLCSPFHKIRLLTLHIFSLFEQPHDSDASERIIQWPVFSLCLSAELVPPMVHEYRKKLQLLESLEFTAISAYLLKYPEYSKVPLYFLLGNLYINFQLLWEPTIKLIASYAQGMDITGFWEVFRERLHFAKQQITYSKQEAAPYITLNSDFLSEFFSKQNQVDDKPDYNNYRLLLWKTMAEFPEICETKNRDISPLFLAFLEEEYFKSNAEVAYSWSIKIRNPSAEEKEVDDTELMETEEPMEDAAELAAIRQELVKVPKSTKTSAKEMLKTLLAHMNIFSKMKNPRSIYREPDLNRVYLDLLTHKNPEVQKMALNCVMSYKRKFLIPYREHLYGLIEDRSFKTELTVFRIDKESELIQIEHRGELIPFVLRILYGKMLARTGARSGGSGQLRRSLVLRFLAGCHENEMCLFVEMAFKIYAKYMNDDPVVMVNKILDTMDLEHIIPPKRLQSSLNLLSVVLDKFGRLMGQRLLPYLLKILFCISAIVQGILACRDTIHPGYLPIILTLRNSCQGTAARFFEHFDNYAWSELEVDVVFQTLVWPWLEKLPVEGIHSPTSLLKIFLVWSKHPRYFVLLGKHAIGNTSLTPLPYIMNLLLHAQSHPSVTTAIMELVERLLTLQDHEEARNQGSDVAPDIPVTSKLPVDLEAITKLSLSENLNYGSCLLLPHIPAILERLERRLGSKKNRSLSQRELIVLSRVTELVWESSTSDKLLHLLLPLLQKKMHAGEETVSHLITTLDNLFKNVTQPEKHLRSLAPLFGEVNAPGLRKLLNGLLATVAEHSNEEQKARLVTNAQLISRLNAFDAKWVEQPDFNQRLDGFKEVHKLLENREIDLDLGVIIIHNCFHFIRTEKDLSLKDSAGYCLRKVAPAVSLQYRDVPTDVEFLVSDTILCLVRAGIRDKNETVQQESIKLLGGMARECSELHPVLQDLSKLTNKADPEVDFFENLLHLQSHRKSRALLKFCQVMKDLIKAPTARTLTHFILPVASGFLCSEKYAHKNNVVDAAVETIGTVCRLLPWHQYETILRFYLAKMRYQFDFQKQLVRIVVAILDAFHFDLSRAQASDTQDKNEDMERADVKLRETEESHEQMEVAELSRKSRELDSVEADTHKPLETGLEELVDRLESLLDSECDAPRVEETDSKTLCESASVPVPAVDREAVLNKSVATHVVQIITTGLLPQIHRVMAQLTQAELSHKFNKKQTASDKEEEGVLRVPIAVAAVKLLQHLPSHMMDQNLPGILMKLCTFLKSRLESIRRVTRETLQKIMLTLGPKYLGILLHEMSAMLTKGYQVHVLIYTIHAILVSLKSLFQPKDIDCNLQSILELCKKDLFGSVAEEKEVDQITGKLQEARTTKSYDTFQILAQFVTEKCFLDLILPLREMLVHSHSFKVIHKCSECLRRVALGLADNSFVSVESLLVFLYGIVSESIPELVSEPKKQEITPAQKKSWQRPDIFLIPPEPRNRSGSAVTARTSARTNAHILVEFGLRLFHIILKREKLGTGDLRPFVDPMVSVLCDCLKAQHVKLTTIALHCMSRVLKMDLPALIKNIENITASVFKLLHMYAVAGLSKGDNFDLVVAAFKVIAVLVRDVKYHVIGAEQMKALLLYAEQDMHDFNRQATAFALLKAVLARKLVAPEIHDVMKKVSELSITSEHDHVRLQARQVFLQYLMDYPHGKKLRRYLDFYIAQLDYEVQLGRESALQMIMSFIISVPIDTLTSYHGYLFINLGAVLVIDDSPECKTLALRCAQTMLERLDKIARNQLFDVITDSLKYEKVECRHIAAQLCGIFVMIEKSDFENRLPKVLSLILQQFSSDFANDSRPGRYVRIVQPNDDNPTEREKEERKRDHLFYQVLILLKKICIYHPDILTNSKWEEDMETIAGIAHNLLAHRHEWVRIAAAELLGDMFSSLDVKKVAAAVSDRHSVSRKECGYFYHHTKRRLKSLVLDLCAQLQPSDVRAELVDQVVRDLIFLGRVLKNVSLEGQVVENMKCDSGEDSEDNQTKLSLMWMIRRMRKVVNIEIVLAPKSTAMRAAVFMWTGAIVKDLGRDELLPVAYQLLAPLSRELVGTDESESGKELCQLAKEISNLMKKKLGMEVYIQHLSRLQINLAARRADRKKLRAQEVLTEPEKAAKRKIKKHLKKREAKKKKIENIKGRKFMKKNRKEINIEDI